VSNDCYTLPTHSKRGFELLFARVVPVIQGQPVLSWYYARQKLAQKSSEQENELKTFVEKLLKDYIGYGVRRVTKALQKAGFVIGYKKFRRLLKEWGLAWQPAICCCKISIDLLIRLPGIPILW
jgi:hypothetical protein